MSNSSNKFSFNPITGLLDLISVFYPPNGTATLVGGAKTVASTDVTVNSEIFLTNNKKGGTLGDLYIDNVVAGISFDIVSTSGTDTSTIAWLLFEPQVATASYVGANAALTLIGP